MADFCKPRNSFSFVSNHVYRTEIKVTQFRLPLNEPSLSYQRDEGRGVLFGCQAAALFDKTRVFSLYFSVFETQVGTSSSAVCGDGN